jgi:hypothetical protein
LGFAFRQLFDALFLYVSRVGKAALVEKTAQEKIVFQCVGILMECRGARARLLISTCR